MFFLDQKLQEAKDLSVLLTIVSQTILKVPNFIVVQAIFVE